MGAIGVRVPDGFQLELALWSQTSLRAVLRSYMGSTKCSALADATVKEYGERGDWLMRVLGETTDVRLITFDRLERLVYEHGPEGHGLMHVTLKKRLVHLRAAMKYAAQRKVISKDDIPDLPHLINDGVAGKTFYTSTQFGQFRDQLPPESALRQFADICFWTGHHTIDVFTMTWGMLAVDKPFVLESGEVITQGSYLRRNHKNPRCVENWFPMDERFRAVVTTWPRGAPDELVMGRIWGVSRAFHAAADRAQLPRIAANTGLRRSFASRLAAEGKPLEYIRMALGHEGAWDDVRKRAQRATVAERHYLRPTPELLAVGGKPVNE